MINDKETVSEMDKRLLYQKVIEGLKESHSTRLKYRDKIEVYFLDDRRQVICLWKFDPEYFLKELSHLFKNNSRRPGRKD